MALGACWHGDLHFSHPLAFSHIISHVELYGQKGTSHNPESTLKMVEI